MIRMLRRRIKVDARGDRDGGNDGTARMTVKADVFSRRLTVFDRAALGSAQFLLTRKDSVLKFRRGDARRRRRGRRR